jgi:predicted nucleic acid-binding Zn ribbon protein
VAGRIRRTRWSGAGPDRARDPQPLGDALKGWLSTTGAAREVTRASLFTRWAEIVGAGVADHCRPVPLVDGELVLQAESTAWATQLRLMASTILKRVNAEIGRGTVTRIRTKGPSGPSWRFGNRHVSGRGPRDTYG